MLFPILDFLVFIILRLPKNGAARIVAEILLLKLQVRIAHRSRVRPKLFFIERLMIGLYAIFIPKHRLKSSCIVIKPSSVCQYMRIVKSKRFSRLILAKHRRKPGPKGKPPELIKLVVDMKRFNPSYGTPRIAMQINNVSDVTISEPTVRRILKRHFQPMPLRPRELRNLLAALLGVGIAGLAYALFSIRLAFRKWREPIKHYTKIAPKKQGVIINKKTYHSPARPNLSEQEKALAPKVVSFPIILAFHQDISVEYFPCHDFEVRKQQGHNPRWFSRDGPWDQPLQMAS